MYWMAHAAGSVPEWAADPPKDSAEWFWGAGQGPDLESARRSALRSISARLRSSISGQVSSRVTESNGRVDRSASVSVSEDVLKTDFSRAEVDRSTQVPGQGFFALVKVDRGTFVADTRAQLSTFAKPIAEVESKLNDSSVLEQFLSLRRVTPQLERAVQLCQLLVGAGLEDEGRAGVVRYSALLERTSDLTAKLVFELRAPPPDADIATAVGTYLSEQGMRSATARTAGANVLTIESSTREDELFGSKISKVRVNLAVMDEKGRSVAGKTYEVSGSSRYDFKGSRQAAVAKLLADMRSAGPSAALGFK